MVMDVLTNIPHQNGVVYLAKHLFLSTLACAHFFICQVSDMMEIDIQLRNALCIYSQNPYR